MIELFTGLPGSGKTLSVVERIAQARAEGRTVYVAGLDGLSPSLGCIEIDPLTWQECPDGSLIVVDEAQRWMPTRSAQREVIPPVAALSEHRHRGYDFILTTQSPAMLDSWVRRLVGRHVHVVRKFGTRNAERIIWGECVDDPQSLSLRARGQSEIWRYPPALFELYKSATIHTHSARLPWRLIALPVVLVATAAAIWATRDYLSGLEAAASETAPETTQEAPAVPIEGPAQPRPVAPLPVRTTTAQTREPLTTEQYLASITPRVEGMPWSAPIFDGKEPVELPRIACIQAGATCRCYTEQATRIKVEFDHCATIARFGIYRPEFERG